MGLSVFPMQESLEASICIVLCYSPEGAVESGFSTSLSPNCPLPSAMQRAFCVCSSTLLGNKALMASRKDSLGRTTDKDAGSAQEMGSWVQGGSFWLCESWAWREA